MYCSWVIVPEAWQGWVGIACIATAAFAVAIGYLRGGSTAEPGSLFSAQRSTRKFEKLCAIYAVLAIVAACVLFVWSLSRNAS